MTPEPEGQAARSVSESDAVTESVFLQLSALDALGLGTGEIWLDADQVRYLRIFVEEGIDELARFDDALFDFMAECATLAGENMQDARLLAIEKRLEPDGGTFDGFLANLGLMLALELLFVSGVTYGLPAVIAFAAVRAQSVRARRLVVDMATEEMAAQGIFAELATDLMKKRALKRDLSAASAEAAGAGWSSQEPLWQAMRELRLAEDSYDVARAAVEWNERLVGQAREALKQVDTPAARELKSQNLRTFLHGALAESALARLAENSASAVTGKIIAAHAGTQAQPPPFQTSTLIGRFLAEIRGQRNDAAREWALTRRHVRVLTDDQFIDSDLVHELYLQIHWHPGAAAAEEIMAANRSPIVAGVEGVLWLTWLRRMNALGKRAVRDFPLSSVNPFHEVTEGGVTDNLFVTYIEPPKIGTDPRSFLRTVDGVLYPGLDLITDEQAEYLYAQFAADFFTQSPEAAPAPMTFAPDRYAEVPSLARTTYGMTNYDRLDRISEMKLLVIEFFRTASEKPSEIGGPGGAESRAILRALLELPADADPVGDYLRSLAPISEPDDPEPAEPPRPPPPSGAASAELQARDAVTKLASLVTDLDLMITQYPAESFDDSAAGVAAGAEADELLRAIEEQQDAVRQQLDLARALAADQKAVLDEVRAYEPRISRLRAWPPPAWTWYGPPAQEPSPTSPPAAPMS